MLIEDKYLLYKEFFANQYHHRQGTAFYQGPHISLYTSIIHIFEILCYISSGQTTMQNVAYQYISIFYDLNENLIYNAMPICM